MRKSRIRLATLLVSGLTAATLMLGTAAPAQAATKPPAPTSIKRPGCETISGTDIFNPCRVPAAYDNIQRLTKKALASKNYGTRAGIIRFELLSLFGNTMMWGDRKKVTPIKDNLSREAFDEMLLEIPNPTDAVVRCYGNWMKYHVSTKGASAATIQNFYSIIGAVKTGKDAYGIVKGKVKSEQKYIKALSQPEKALKMLRNDRMKDLIKKTFGVDVDSKQSPPTASDMADGYIDMILNSHQAVTQAQYSSSIQQLFHNIMGNSKKYAGCQNISEPKPKPKPAPKPTSTPTKYVIKSATQTFNGADLTSDTGDLIGSVDAYDAQHRGYCNPVGTAMMCKAYDSANSIHGADTGLRLNSYFNMPDDIDNAVPGSLVTMQITTSFGGFQGGADWEYGAYSNDPKASGANFSPAPGSQTLQVAEFNGRTLPNLDYWLHVNSTMTIQKVTVNYTYTVKQ